MITMIWMLLYTPDQMAYHIERVEEPSQFPNNGYGIVKRFYQYDMALTYYKKLIEK